MDGHDDNNNNSGAANSVQQPIFTPVPPQQTPRPQPQPSVTGSVVEPTPTPSTGLSHPFISNHPAQVVSNETGDIVIGKEKHKKTPQIIVFIALALTVLTGIIFLIIFLMTPTKKNVIQAFNYYADYMENGPDVDYEVVKPAILHLEENYSNDEQGKVIKATQQAFQEFYNVFNRARLPLSQDAKNAMDKQLEQYREQLSFIIAYNSFTINSNTLLDVYLKDGRDAAINSVAQFLPKYEHNEWLKSDIERISEYYYKYIAIYDLYSKYGCARNGTVDNRCVSTIFDPELQQLINYNDMIIDVIRFNYNAVVEIFQSSTESIRNELESM